MTQDEGPVEQSKGYPEQKPRLPRGVGYFYLVTAVFWLALAVWSWVDRGHLYLSIAWTIAALAFGAQGWKVLRTRES